MAAKQTTKQRVRQVAQKLFRERGYAAVGMRELAKEVGIQAPSLYNHYKSKDDLLREICFDMAKYFFEAFDKAVATEEKFQRKLKAVIKAHIGVIASSSDKFVLPYMVYDLSPFNNKSEMSSAICSVLNFSLELYNS